MNNFLTTLYFDLFRGLDEEKILMGIHEFDSDNANIRNDQKITDIRESNKRIRNLITEYMKTI